MILKGGRSQGSEKILPFAAAPSNMHIYIKEIECFTIAKTDVFLLCNSLRYDLISSALSSCIDFAFILIFLNENAGHKHV